MVVISATTARLVKGYFLWQAKEVPPLPGGDQGLVAYDILGESEARSRLDIVVKQRKLTPFIGREAEVAVLRERWQQVQEGTVKGGSISFVPTGPARKNGDGEKTRPDNPEREDKLRENSCQRS
jgi:hypothetical protein